MFWIYLVPAIAFSVVAALVFMVAFFGDRDEEESLAAALVFVGAWIWPLVIPVALIVLVILIFLHIFITFGWMQEPKWWPELY